jgi:hypothetical protein
MSQNIYLETQSTMVDITPQELCHEIEMLSDAWVVNDPEFEPLSSSDIRQSVAHLLRSKFFVIEGGLRG